LPRSDARFNIASICLIRGSMVRTRGESRLLPPAALEAITLNRAEPKSFHGEPNHTLGSKPSRSQVAPHRTFYSLQKLCRFTFFTLACGIDQTTNKG
jgi:hypothetical protein